MIQFWQPRILVIGSAHLDVFGDFRDPSTVDKKGEVSYSIGGTAFNIATNLALHGKRTYLYTYLDKDSYVADAIHRRLRINGVNVKYVFLQRNLHGSPIRTAGFVAHRNADTKDLVSAVTATSVGDTNFCDDTNECSRLNGAIGKSRVIVLDCNLTPHTLKHVITKAKDQGKSVVVAGVSQSKLLDYCSDTILEPKHYPDFVIANSQEFSYCCEQLQVNFSIASALECKTTLPTEQRDQIKDFCRAIKAKHLIVSAPQKYLALSLTGESQSYPPPNFAGAVITSRTGAGDAMTAAVVDTLVTYLSQNKEFKPYTQDFKLRVDDYVGRTLRTLGATPGSDIRFMPDDSLEGLPFGRKVIIKIRRFIIEKTVGRVVELVLVGLAFLILVFLSQSKHPAVKCWGQSKEIGDLVRCWPFHNSGTLTRDNSDGTNGLSNNSNK